MSLTFHGLVVLGFVRMGGAIGGIATGPPADVRLAREPEPRVPEARREPQPTVMLGREDSTEQSLTWLGYTEPTEHSAPLGITDQSAMSPSPGAEDQQPGTPGASMPSPPAAAREAAEAPDPAEAANPTEAANVLAPATLPETAAAAPPAETAEPPPEPPAQPQVETMPPPMVEPMPEPATEPPRPAIEPPQSANEPATSAVDPAQARALADAAVETWRRAAEVIERAIDAARDTPPPTPADQPAEASPPASGPAPVPAPPSAAPAFPAPTSPAPTPGAPASVPSPSPSPSPATPSPAVPPSPSVAPGSRGGARGAGPGLPADKEAVATAIREAPVIRPGQVVASRGLDIRTVRPRWSLTAMWTQRPRNPTVIVTFGRDGRVKRAEWASDGEFVYDTGSEPINQPLLTAIYSWTARGKALESIPADDPEAGLPLLFTIMLVP